MFLIQLWCILQIAILSTTTGGGGLWIVFQYIKMFWKF